VPLRKYKLVNELNGMGVKTLLFKGLHFLYDDKISSYSSNKLSSLVSPFTSVDARLRVEIEEGAIYSKGNTKAASV
jgi:hypothetical protein